MQSDSLGHGLSFRSHPEQVEDNLDTGLTGMAGATTATTAMKPSPVYNTTRGMTNANLQSIHPPTYRETHVNSDLGLNDNTGIQNQRDAMGGHNNDESKTASIGEGSGNTGEKNETSNATPPTKKQKTIARVQFLTLCLTLFLAGWNDGTTGPLLPRIQEVYKVSRFPLSSFYII